MSEVWRPLPNYARYEVSDLGRVKSFRKRPEGRLLKLSPGAGGYLTVMIRRDDQCYMLRRVHQIVLEAFVGPCPAKQEGLHADNDVTNNCLTNLRWGTHFENMAQAVREGRCPSGRERSLIRWYGLSNKETI